MNAIDFSKWTNDEMMDAVKKISAELSKRGVALSARTSYPMRWNPSTSQMEPFNYMDDLKA